MRKQTGYTLLFSLSFLFVINCFAQTNPTIVSGTVKNNKTKEAVTAVSVTIKGTTTGTFTDDNGYFKFTTSQQPPFKLVISSVGYSAREVEFNGKEIATTVEPSYTLGNEVVVAASRVPERILESPVSIERVTTSAIRNAIAPSYYDLIGTLKGVDITTSSLTFKTVTTRGLGGSGNLRFNQLVDGMDNQAPGLNFSVGSIVGITELDVENMELLSGASSALYGPGGMNGTLLINSKDPFKYQGLSFQVKEGVKDIDQSQRSTSAYSDWSVRWANTVTEKFAYKIGVQYIKSTDWLGNNQSDYSRSGATGFPFGQPIAGNRQTDPNYDGVNVYGDETTSSLLAVGQGALDQTKAALISQYGTAIGTATYNGLYAGSQQFLAAYPTANISSYNSFLTANGGGALVSSGASNFFYGSLKNFYNGVNVSRTGYAEKDVINPTTDNFKLSGGLYYKITSSLQASLTANWGTGNTVYTGSDRYSLKDLKMGQYKAELKSKNWFLRGYATLEDAGSSYNATIAARLFNEAWSSSPKVWYPTYTTVFTQAMAAGANVTAADAAARAVADANRPSGPIYNNPLFQQIVSTPISKGGALFLDKTSLYSAEGQYNLTDLLGLAKSGTEFLVGGSWREYSLNSQGTLFADTAGRIKINEMGLYGQLSQKLFKDVVKLSLSGRYDKNENFDPRFTPRVSAVVKLAKDNYLRFSYQEAYRFPSTQNQWINLVTGSGTLVGGLQQMINYYQLNTNHVYNASGVINFSPIRPERSNSFEFGYKAVVAKKLMIDAYVYFASFKDFITSSNGLQVATNTKFSVAQNATGTVSTSGWGISGEYLLPSNFSLSANIYSDIVNSQPSDPNFISYFNTPKYRVNVGLANSGFGYKNRFGFGVAYKWQDSFYYQGSFACGNVAAFGTVDAMVSCKIPKIKSLVKLGASNLLNQYYTNGYGNSQVGGLYYISFGYNVF